MEPGSPRTSSLYLKLLKATDPTVDVPGVGMAFRILFRVRQNLGEAVARVERELGAVPEVAEVLAFIRASKRGVAMGPRANHPGDGDAAEG